MSAMRDRADRAWTEHKMGRQGPRRPSLMDSAWNQSSPLTPGEVDNEFQEKPGQKKGGTPPAGGASRYGGTGPVGGQTNGAAGGRAVKITTEPAAALKLIDTEKRGFAAPGTCMAPLQYRAGANNAAPAGSGANGTGAAENDSMMNPFAKPWTPQVGQFQPIGVIQQPMQQMPVTAMPAPQMQQGIQPMMGTYQPQPMAPQAMPPPNGTMNATMPNGAVGCFYATPTLKSPSRFDDEPIQVAAPYTTMAPMQQVSMVMVPNPGPPGHPGAPHPGLSGPAMSGPMSGPMSSPQADVHAGHHGPMAPGQQGPMAPGPGPMGPGQHPNSRMAAPMAPIGPPQMMMQGPMAPQMGMAPQNAMPPAVPHVAPPAPQNPGEPPLGSPELPSKGSALHAFRACKPCAFFYQEGCSNKEHCAFCHLCEPGERKRRKKERRMARREAQEG